MSSSEISLPLPFYRYYIWISFFALSYISIILTGIPIYKVLIKLHKMCHPEGGTTEESLFCLPKNLSLRKILRFAQDDTLEDVKSLSRYI